MQREFVHKSWTTGCSENSTPHVSKTRPNRRKIHNLLLNFSIVCRLKKVMTNKHILATVSYSFKASTTDALHYRICNNFVACV